MFTYLPGDGKRKKAVVQQAITMPNHTYGGFDKIKAAVSCAQRLTTPISKVTAALGGSRREAQRVST